MKVFYVLGAVFLIAACGVDGEPQPPQVSATQTFGINSQTGGFTKTTLAVEFGG